MKHGGIMDDETLDWNLEERDEFMQTEHDEPETEVLVEADE